ncbi:hypothetical protein [uncultured Tateyamaria sp.]|uniref:hypothetical protein n=1 Tax=uncultured Tateyamaria sp. TaxID=455651 RepID=UPI00260299E9|nr:hypothetical protein [uncultured Tateyamaria sp.]
MTNTDIEHEIAERFAEVNKNVGLGVHDFTAGKEVTFDDPNTPIVIVSCDGSGPLKGHVFKTKGIAELRNILLNDKPQDGPAIRALQKLQEDMGEVTLGDMRPDLVAQPGDVDEARLLKARMEKLASVFAFGGLGVPERTLEEIDSVLFPSQLTAYTGNKLVLGPGTTLVIDGLEPIVLNFSYVEMAASARIAVYSKASLFFGQVTITDQTSGKDAKDGPQILIAGEPYSAPEAQTGAVGATPEQPKDAEAGKSFFDKEIGKYICTRKPEHGREGLPGAQGGQGAEGGPGRNLQAANVDIIATVGQPLHLMVKGGSGQDGGDGGQGGTGGPGGFPGFTPTGCASSPQGISGPGGRGGAGGNGGDGSQIVDPVRVVKRDTAHIETEVLAGQGGAGGSGGAGGLSPDGNGDGGSGPAGAPGKLGATPSVIPARSLT